MTFTLLAGMLIGFFISLALTMTILWEKFADHGGSILIDSDSGVYRIILNDEIEDWGDQRYVILKVSQSEKRLKRLEDIDPMELEDKHETE